MTKNEDYEDPLCGVLRPRSLDSAGLTEAHGRGAPVFEGVGKARGLQLFPLKASLYAGCLLPSRHRDQHKPIPCFTRVFCG